MLSNTSGERDGEPTTCVTIAHVQQAPAANWLADAYKTFDNSFSAHGLAGRFTAGMYPQWGGLAPSALDNLDQFPGIEVAFDTPHRIRSWSLQSVGRRNRPPDAIEALATALVLQGRSLDGRWRVLDFVHVGTEWDSETGESLPELYTARKNRLDREVQHVELVDKIRVIAVGVQGNGLAQQAGFVWLPQIQLFAGVPVLPRMTSASQNTSRGTVSVRANHESNGFRVFDRAVGSTDIAAIGPGAWYINTSHHFTQNDVAQNGNVSQFGTGGSKAWLALMFPMTRLLGYLYSIDNLAERSDIHANALYAASLYFEGNEIASPAATEAPSSLWDYIDIISLDHCVGNNDFGMTTDVLVAPTPQTALQNYTQALGLPVDHLAFLINTHDQYIARFDSATGRWFNDGYRLQPGTTDTADHQFHNMTTDELLSQPGQSRLNAVAMRRGENNQPQFSQIPDKATIVNQRDDRRMMFNRTAATWSEVPNYDAIDRVHNQTHYADLNDGEGNPLPLSQLRCTAQSIMNKERPSVAGHPVAMPEMQFFGLPAERINTGAVATITYLKAEDSSGNLHSILGKHQRLPYHNFWSGWGGSSTSFRLYLGTIQNINPADRRVYLTVHTASGTMNTSHIGIDHSSTLHRDISVSGDYRTAPAYFEFYMISTNDEKIVLSSGYSGGGVRR